VALATRIAAPKEPALLAVMATFVTKQKFVTTSSQMPAALVMKIALVLEARPFVGTIFFAVRLKPATTVIPMRVGRVMRIVPVLV
jgi:hypothetical protein